MTIKDLPPKAAQLFSRRQALIVAGSALTVPFCGHSVMAAEGLVLANWGGDALIGEGKAYAEPFTAATGIPVTVDGSGPSDGKIKAMVESGSVTWDVCDATAFSAIGLGQAGLLEPIDYGIIDKSKVRSGYIWEHGVCGYYYSYVLTFNQSKLKETPATWADFWDVKRFPGKRTMWKYMEGALEAALLADGVKPEALYPLDVERAFAKLAELKEHLILWDSSSNSQQLLREGEVVMGQIWNTRAHLLEKDSKGAIKWAFKDGLIVPNAWVVPKGSKNVKQAMEFIAFMQDPQRQIEQLKLMAGGPGNPVTAASVPAELAPINSTSDENWALQVKMQPDWYAKNYNDVLGRYLDFFQT